MSKPDVLCSASFQIQLSTFSFPCYVGRRLWRLLHHEALGARPQLEQLPRAPEGGGQGGQGERGVLRVIEETEENQVRIDNFPLSVSATELMAQLLAAVAIAVVRYTASCASQICCHFLKLFFVQRNA